LCLLSVLARVSNEHAEKEAAMDAIIWLKILVLAVVWFGIGAIWYSPWCLGKAWMAALDKTHAEIEAERGPNKGPLMIAALVSLIQTAILGFVIGHLKIDSVFMAAVTGFLMAAGFGLLAAWRSDAFRPSQNTRLVWIDSGYDLVSAAIIAGLLSWWL